MLYLTKKSPLPIPLRIEPHTEDIHLHPPEKGDDVTDEDAAAEDLFKATEPGIQEVATRRVVDQLPADLLKDADLTAEKEIKQPSKVDKEHLQVKAEEPESIDLEKTDEDQDTVKELPKETIESVQDEQLDEEHKDAAKTFAKETQVDVQDRKPSVRDKEGETVSIIESKQPVLSKGDIVHDKESDIESETKDEQKADKSLEPSSEEELFEEAEGGIREEKEAIVPVDEKKDDNLGKLSLDLEEITIPKEKEISDTSDDDQFKDAVPGKSILVDEYDAEYSDQELDTGEEYTGEDILQGLSEEISETEDPHVEKGDTLCPEKEKTDAIPTVIDEYSGVDILEKSEEVSETETPEVTKLDETTEAAYPEEEKIDTVRAVTEDRKTETVTTIAPAIVESATEDITVSAKLIMRGQYQVEEHPIDVELPISREDAATGLIDVEELRQDVEFTGEKKYVGTFSVDVPVTDAAFDKVVPPPITVHSEANVEDIALHIPKEIDEGKSEPTAAEIDTEEKEDKHMLPKDHEDIFEDAEGGRVEVSDKNKVPKEIEEKEVHAEKDQDKIDELSKEKLEGDEYRLDVTSTDISKEIELKEDETTGRKTEIIEDVEVTAYSPEEKVTKTSAPELEDVSAEEVETAEVEDIEKVVEPSAPPLEEEADLLPVVTTTEDIEEV